MHLSSLPLGIRSSHFCIKWMLACDAYPVKCVEHQHHNHGHYHCYETFCPCVAGGTYGVCCSGSVPTYVAPPSSGKYHKKLYSKVVNYVMDGGGPVWAQSAHSCDLAKIVYNKHPRRAKYQTLTLTSTSTSIST